jgi:hypothetical protein
MQPIRTRSDLALLLERHMAQNTARGSQPAADEDLEVRTALKTYLLEAHGRMRTAPRAALGEVASALGLQITPTAEAELIEISFGDVTLWLDVSNARFPRMYSIGQVKDTDRVVAALVAGTGLVESVWLPPRTLESLAATTQTGMVLFSLRHDRRPLRRTPDRDGIDSVTLRLWGPRAKDTLDKLRRSEVLPAATSVYSVRLRGGDTERYCLAEVFHTGKITAVGNSFLEHEKMIRSILDERDQWSQRFDAYRTPRRFSVEVPWTVDDLGFAVGKIFGGAEPFRLWGLPEQTAPGTYRVRAVDTDVGRSALFTLTSTSLTIEMPARTPASVLVRFVSNLQYHVNADLSADLIAPEPMLQLGLLDEPSNNAFRELSPLHDVARVVLTEACALLLRNQLSITPAMLVESALGEVPTEALCALTRTVMSEAAANEWRTRMYPIQGNDGKIAWRFLDPLPVDASARLRELVRMNRLSQQLVARLAGVPVANWLQLSLFGPESLVPPVHQDEEGAG